MNRRAFLHQARSFYRRRTLSKASQGQNRVLEEAFIRPIKRSLPICRISWIWPCCPVSAWLSFAAASLFGNTTLTSPT